MRRNNGGAVPTPVLLVVVVSILLVLIIGGGGGGDGSTAHAWHLIERARIHSAHVLELTADVGAQLIRDVERRIRPDMAHIRATSARVVRMLRPVRAMSAEALRQLLHTLREQVPPSVVEVWTLVEATTRAVGDAAPRWMRLLNDGAQRALNEQEARFIVDRLHEKMDEMTARIDADDFSASSADWAVLVDEFARFVVATRGVLAERILGDREQKRRVKRHIDAHPIEFTAAFKKVKTQINANDGDEGAFVVFAFAKCCVALRNALFETIGAAIGGAKSANGTSTNRHAENSNSRQRLTLFIVRAIELLDDADVFPLLETTQDANTNRRELRKLIGKAARRNDALFKEALLDAKTQLHDDDGDGLFLKFVLDEFA